jgi:nucleoside-diphosphate-sugar epimerase
VRLLVAGCGYLGTEVARRLTGTHEVFALRRSDAPAPEGVTAIRGDLAYAASLGAVPDDLDGVVYAAAAGAREDEAYKRIYVDGVSRLAERVARSSPALRRFVLVGSTAVYHQMGGARVDEASPTEPANFSGQRLLQGETALAASGLPGTVLRLGGIYGPGRTSLLQRVASGQARIASGPPHHVNRIHRDDAAAAIVHLLALTEAPPLLLGVDDDPAPEPVVLGWLAELLGVPTPPVAARSAGGRRAAGNKRCRNARLRATGFAFSYPTFREGYGALLAAAGGPAAFALPSGSKSGRI